MKRSKTAGYFVAVIAPIALSAKTEPVWHSTRGPAGGGVLVLLATPDGTLLAGTTKGLFRSEENGKRRIVLDKTNDISALAVRGNTLFAATLQGNFLRSEDNGKTWTPINNGMFYREIEAVVAQGDPLFAATDAGVFSSEDGGNSWTPFSNEIRRENLDPSATALLLADGVLLAGTRENLFRSEDQGKTWTPFGLKDQTIRSLVVAGDTLFAGTLGGNLPLGREHLFKGLRRSEGSFGFLVGRSGKSSLRGDRQGRLPRRVAPAHNAEGNR